MDVIGIKAGCTFTAFSDSDYNGNSLTLRAEDRDRWVVFSRWESLVCTLLSRHPQTQGVQTYGRGYRVSPLSLSTIDLRNMK